MEIIYQLRTVRFTPAWLLEPPDPRRARLRSKPSFADPMGTVRFTPAWFLGGETRVCQLRKVQSCPTMESEATQLYRWFQSRATQAGQRPRATLGALSASQQAKLQAELQGIVIAVCGTSSREPAAGAMAVMSRAVLQFIEVLMNRALDHAASAGGTEFSEKNILGVLSQHNEYQAARAATLTRKYHRIRTLTSFEATHVPVEGFHESERSASFV